MLPKLVTPIPGPRSRELARKLRCYESQNVTYIDSGFPIFWERAKGANVWDVDGNRFLDLTCAFGVTTLGHSNPQIVSSVQKQSRKLLHAMGDVHPSALKPLLCERLSAITFERWVKNTSRKLRGKTILCNSGFEAVEAALKTAYLKTKKRGVLAFTGSYHGLGYGALDTTGWKEFRDPFKKQIAQFTTFVPYPHCYRCPFQCENPDRVKKLEIGAPKCLPGCQSKLTSLIRSKLRGEKIGAILVEPIQGRGGEIVPPAWFLPMLRALADQYEIPLIFDEIYTGFHRTGPLFACEDVGDGTGVIPDLICLGKALTGGFPLSACVGESQLMDEAWPESTGEAIHTSTFLGHPVGCAMALKNLLYYKRSDLQHSVKAVEESLQKELCQLENRPFVGQIRGRGLAYGIELIGSDGCPSPTRCFQIIKEALKNGLLLLGGGPHHNVLSLSIPVCITENEVKFTLIFIRERLTWV